MNYLWILTLIFVIAKLTGAVHWSWWLVLSPVLAAAGLSFLLLATIVGVLGLALFLGR